MVGISDMAISTNPDEKLITYSLGSCVGITMYDPMVRVGGLIHCLLPSRRLSGGKEDGENPLMCVDSGLAQMLQELFDMGAHRENLIVKMAGGSRLFTSRDLFKIGERNVAVARKFLWRNSMMIAAEDVGGSVSRTVWLDMGTGETHLRVDREERLL